MHARETRREQREEFTRILLQNNRDVTSRFMPAQRKLAVVTLDNTRSSQCADFQISLIPLSRLGAAPYIQRTTP